MVDEKPLVILGARLVDQVVELGIGGGGPLQAAVTVSDEHLWAAGGDREEAIRRLIATHVRLAATSGFVTGLGGIVTLPVTVPAATTSLYVIATRMTAGIAHLRGYDVATEEVRSAVLVSLMGSAGAATLKKAGIAIGRKSTTAALHKVSHRALMEINKRVGYRLVAMAGQKGAANLSKLVPLVGGPIGATVDGVSCRTIASYARRTFPPHSSPRGARVVDGEIMS